MRIGIDCRTIQETEPAGTAHYTKELVRALLDIDKENQYFLFFDQIKNIPEEFKRPNVKIAIIPKIYLPFISSHFLFSRALKKHRLDVFHGPANVLPIGYRGASVLTIHDLAIYINPEWFPKQTFSTGFLVPRSLAKAKKIIAVSENTKNDLKKIFRIPENKIKVIYEGIKIENPNQTAVQAVFDKFGINTNEPYLFFLGTIEPRKNLIALFAGYKKLLEKFQNTPKLILAGGRGWKNEDIFEAIKKWRLENNIKYLGYVSSLEKFALMKGSLAFVYPSLYEGFGLPILEAMKLEIPVLSSRISSIPEIAKDAALLVDPNDDDEIANSLEKLWRDENLSEQLKAVGQSRAQNFTWQKTAEQTLAVYEEGMEIKH